MLAHRIIARIANARRNFVTDTRGNVALLFGLMSMVLFMAMGGGLDFARAYLARQKLSQVATMACQYASRPAIVDTSTSSYGGSNGSAAYINNVTGFISTTWQTQKVNLTQTNGTPFTYTPGGAANVNLTATMPTTFIQIVGINSVSLAAQSHCYDNVAAITQKVPDSNGQFVLKESFEANGTAGGYTFYKPNGTVGTQATPTAYTSATGYTGSSGTQWHITGYCLEQDSVGVIESTVADGNFSVELDCDNGSGTKGNSAISTQAYLAAGTYELRYNYTSRVDYPNYNPTYICGTAASDLSWANDTNSSGGPVANALRSNQINVYLDVNNPVTNAPPNHTTIDGTQSLPGSNLIDMCVYAQNWVERSVTMSVTTPGYYWLTFAADGTSDSYGGQLDNIRLCRVTCTGTVQDNFPSAWTAGKVLFADTFESPVYLPNFLTSINTAANMNNSLGTSGPSSGWPNQSTSGWVTTPYNQIQYDLASAGQGNQNVDLDMYIGVSDNRAITRSFLLDPGYYQVSYKYVSNALFPSVPPTCTAAPNSTSSLSKYATGSATTLASLRLYPAYSYTLANDTNIVGVFMSNGQLVSTPIGGGAFGSLTSYSNPDGTVTTTPKVSPISVNLSSYNLSQYNPVIDLCGYAGTWQSRSVNILITKPGYYWLTFAALGTADQIGGAIDDIKVTVLGSPYMSSPPSSSLTTIPVPDPQPGSSVAFTGFTITANPLTP
jgi:Flp pilus assembly protein TadG